MTPYWESDDLNHWSYLKDASPETHKELWNLLKVRPKSYFFDVRYRSGIWDGWERFYDTQRQRLLTGMIPFARQIGFDFEEKILATAPLEVEDFNFEYQLVHPTKPGEIVELNRYQKEAILKVADGEFRRGIYDHITAAGKTVEVAALCALLKPLQCTITVPSIGLLEQTIEELGIMLQEKIGVLGGGKSDFEDCRVIVAYDGFLKKYEKSPLVKALALETQVLISDELHTATTRLYPFYRKCTRAYFRFGFSGSFFDIDPDRIFSTAGFFGGVITKVDDADTLEAGRTVPPKFLFYEYPLRQTRDLDYGTAYTEVITENAGLNKFFARLIAPYYEEGKTILVLVKRIDQCTNFQKALAELHVESEVYNGRISTEKRRSMRAEFKGGILPVLVATEQTLGVGVNLPRIEILLNLGGGLSDSGNRQKWGRGLRSFNDKDAVIDIEPYYTGHKWFMKHSKARLALAKNYSTGSVEVIWYKPTSPL